MATRRVIGVLEGGFGDETMAVDWEGFLVAMRPRQCGGQGGAEVAGCLQTIVLDGTTPKVVFYRGSTGRP